MDVQTLLDNFGTVAESPGGIDRLRRLILNLAVRGQLVPQDPIDPSVSSERLAAGRKDLIELGQINKPRHPEGLAVEKPPYSIPATWHWYHLGDVGAVVGGGTPSSRESRFWADGNAVPWLTPADMRGQTSRYVTCGERDITEEGLASSSAQLLPAQSVLFSSRAPIGHVGIAQTPLATNQGFKSCVPYLPGMAEYLYVFLKKIGPDVSDAATGTTFKEVSGKQVALIPVPVPPLAEQDRIVAKVDELMQLCDDLEARQHARRQVTDHLRASSLYALTTAGTEDELRKTWSRISSNWCALADEPPAIDELRDACLELGVRGKLTSPRASDEHAAETLRRCSDARTDLHGREKNRRQSDLPVPDAVPYSLPDGWAWAQIDDCFQVSGGIQKSAKRRPDKNPHPYLRVANVQRGRLDLGEISEFELFDGELERYRLEPGDLLVVEGNGSESEIGRCGRWDGQIADCVHQNHLIRCRPLDCDLERYALLYLNSPSGSMIMKSLAVTTSGLFNLSVGKIRAIQIPLPPREERLRIVEAVNDLLSKCDDLDTALRERFSAAGTLADGVLASVER